MANFKRILAALLASLMLVPTLAACSEEQASAEDTTAAATETTVPVETEPRETERHEIKDDLPADLKFDGRTFRIYVSIQSTNDEFVAGVEEKAGDIVNDAVTDRNLHVQEQLDFKLMSDGFNWAWNTVAAPVSQLILAGDSTYDMFMAHQTGATQLVAQRLFVNAYELKYINFEQPWWANELMDELSLGKDYRFLLAGDFFTNTIGNIRANYFNKTMYTNLYGDPNELYQLTLDGKFTIDHMNTLVAGAYADLNNDGITDLDDRLGMVTQGLAASVDPFVYGSDIVYTTRDEEGFVQLQMMSDDAVMLAEKLCSFFHQRAVCTKAPSHPPSFFKNGNILFLGNCRLIDSTSLRDMEDDFGYLPFPKYDDEQEEYYSLVHDTALHGCISVASQNLDMAGAVLEALNAESYRIVTPAWYESALKLKYARDDISSQMIDLIKGSMTTNFIFAYNFALNNIGMVYRTLVGGNNPNYASTVESRLSAAETMLADLVKVFKGQ